jgi:zinc transport system ATP-binding protein
MIQNIKKFIKKENYEFKKTMIDVKNLSFSYSKHNPIFKNANFEIHSGDLVAVIGPNGSGKSTLVKILSKLIPKQKGEINIYGKFSYIPQKFNQDINFPAKVSELLDLECCGCELRNQVSESLNIQDLEKKQFKDLSGGQQQRVLISLSLLSNPDILILDEPTVGIDLKTQEEFYKLLKKLNKQRNLTIIFVTHDTGMVSHYFDKILVVHNKHICLEDSKQTKKYQKTFMETHHETHHHKTENKQENKKNKTKGENK